MADRLESLPLPQGLYCVVALAMWAPPGSVPDRQPTAAAQPPRWWVLRRRATAEEGRPRCAPDRHVVQQKIGHHLPYRLMPTAPSGSLLSPRPQDHSSSFSPIADQPIMMLAPPGEGPTVFWRPRCLGDRTPTSRCAGHVRAFRRLARQAGRVAPLGGVGSAGSGTISVLGIQMPVPGRYSSYPQGPSAPGGLSCA